MTISYIRSNYKDIPIALQQERIFNYIKSYSLSLDKERIDSYQTDPIESINFLKNSVNSGDMLLIDDLWVFGDRIGKIVKALNCLTKRGVATHLCSSQIIIDKNLPILILLEILDIHREKIVDKNIASMGRPKGSISKSKFDIYKERIILMLKERKSVSEIANLLEVSRSSLKDYINSRNLKNIAFVDIEDKDIKLQNSSFILPTKNCIII